MPKFSQPETAGRLFLSGVGGLFVLQADEKKIITILRPGEGIWADEVVREEIDGFLLRGRTQRLIAQTSKHWAPVYVTSAIPAEEGGGAPYRAAGAYVILDRYERSAQSLIDGRVNLENADLRNIMEGAIQGLIDLREKLGRAHGNLKASNILLNNSADLAQAVVHLTDPAPDGALLVGAHAERKDLADLGKLLYELVNLRPYNEGTIGKSREWSRLGPNGEDWRKLCNALLDVGAPAESRDLDKILPRVKTWTQVPPKSRKPQMIAASILFVLVFGGGSLWYFTRPPKLAFNQANWENLCLSYASWFRDFKDHLTDDKARRQYSAPPYPTGVIDALNKYADELDKSSPQQVAGSPTQTLELAVAPTEDAKTGYGPNHTLKGVQLIDEVKTALRGDHWKQLGTLDKAAAAYEERGWKRPAEEIRKLERLVQVPELPDAKDSITTRVKNLQTADLYGAVDATVKAAVAVNQIDAGWNNIQETIKQLPATGVPLVNAFPKFADGFPRSELDAAKPVTLVDVTSLAASFAQIEGVATELVTDLTNRPGHEIVYAELAKDPAMQVPGEGPTLELYGKVPAVASGYVKMATDPRESVDWTKSLDAVQKETIAVILDANPQDGNLSALQQQHAALSATIGTFVPGGPAYLPPIEKNSGQIAAAVAAANDSLKALADTAHQAVAPYIIDPVKYIAEVKARLNTSPVLKGTPAVVEEWKKAHTALLAKLESNPAQIKNYRAYKAMDAKFAALETIYLGLDAKIPTTVAGLSEIAGNDWRHLIAAQVATVYRENALRELMTNAALKWADDLPLVDEAGYVSYQRARLSQFEKTRTDTLALLADYATMIDRLDHLQLKANEPAAGVPGWRDLYAKWNGGGQALVADPVIAAALKPFNDRVGALLAIDGIKDYPALLEKIVAVPAAPPEITLTAWRKLETAPVVEALPALDDEDKAETVLTGQINALLAGHLLRQEQASALANEIAAQRPVRWRKWAETLSTPAVIQAALDRMESFKVTLSPATDVAMSYNKKLYDLRKDYEKNLKEAELKQSAAAFVAAVNALPPAVSQDKDIVQLLATIEKPLKQPDTESSAAGAGPKLAGWEQDNSRPEVRLFYFPTKAAPKHLLEFAKVVVTEQGQQKTIWMCTTEMSVGLFADVVNASGKIADLDNTGRKDLAAHWFDTSSNNYDDLGVRVWKIVDRKFVVNSKWLSESVPQVHGKPHYPAGLDPPAPTADDPMQLLSPWSAMYGARLLGCRLPTSDEWHAAYVKFEATGPKDVWNLRGEGPVGKPSWKTQQDFVAKLRTDPTTNQMLYPDKGAFLLPEFLYDATKSAAGAKPWKADDLAKLAPARFTAGPDAYKGSTLWFRKVGTQPGAATPGSGAGAMHDLVGNVAEWVFDGPNAIAIIKDAEPTPAAIDAAIVAGKKNLGIIGGSSLSAPDMPFDKKLEVDPLDYAAVSTGFCDVGFRLAYTAPIDSIGDVLASTFKEPKYLPGAKAKL